MPRCSSSAKLCEMKPAQAFTPSLIAQGLRVAMMALACLASASTAWSQWQWRDSRGQRIFSDTPPPAAVAEKDILQRPKGTPAPSAANPDVAPASAATPAKPPAPAPDAQLEQRKLQLEKAEADKRKAEEKAAEEKAAKARAINCDNARKNKITIESGVRVTTTNAKGEAEYLDETGRAAQLRQANQMIQENCR